MRIVSRSYDGLIVAMAVAAAASLAFITLAIVADVMMRNLGFRPFRWTSAVVEYVLLFSTMAGSPWLVRTGGHVAITTFVERLPKAAADALGRLVILLCAGIAGLISWRALVLAVEEARSGSLDMRSITLPGWLTYAMIGTGMALIAIELLRLLATGRTRAGEGERH
jgi:C4-dicarboxylate transporter DctQ subunit